MNNNISKLEDQEFKLVREFRLQNQDLVDSYQMSDELLMCFIRARKYNLQRASKTLNNYVKMVKDSPELFTNLWVEKVKHLFRHNQLLVSPVRDKRNGRQIFIFCTGEFDSRICSMDEGFRCTLMALQRAIANVKNQLNGVYVILDFKGFGLHQIGQYSPTFMKKFSSLVQGSFPVRVKGIHVVNEPWIIKYLVAMMSPFLSQKINSRVFFHGQNFESLHRHLDPACLPSNYNGELGSMKETMMFVQTYPEDQYSKIFDCFN